MKRLLPLFILIFSSLFAKNATVSIIIPCHIKHIYKLNELLNSYRQQTVLPEQIVISASSLTLDGKSYLNQLKKKTWPFELIILTSFDKQLPGKNRNIACRRATSELFICQDADDFPHPQRVEAIKYLYQKYDFHHLMHLYFHATERISSQEIHAFMKKVHYNVADLKVKFVPSYDLIYHSKYAFRGKVFPHNGAPAFPRKVFEKIQYNEDQATGEDQAFNRAVYSAFSRKIILLSKLYYYCEAESTSKQPSQN